MPVIKPYETRTNAVRPGETVRVTPDALGATEAQANAKMAGALGQAGEAVSTIGQLVQRRQEQDEVSGLHSKLAQAQDRFTTEWQEGLKNADPDEKDAVVERFMTSYDQHMDKLREGISTSAGQRFFDEHYSQQRAHFNSTAFAGAAQLAGEKRILDYQTAMGSLSASVQKDPGSYQNSLQSQESYLNYLEASGEVPRAAVEKLRFQGKQDLAQNMVRGKIGLSPGLAMKDLAGGVYDNVLSGDQKHALITEAHSEVRGRRADLEFARKLDKEAVEAKQEITKKEYLARLTDPTYKPKEPLTFHEINSSNLDSTQREHYVNLLTARGAGEIPKNPKLFNATLARIGLPPGTEGRITNETQITQMTIDGLMPFEDSQKLVAQFQGRKTTQGRMEGELFDNFIKSADQQIIHGNPALENLDSEAAARSYNFKFLAQKKWDEFKKTNKNVELLVTPGNPEYLGNYLPQFQADWDTTFKKYIQRMTPVATLGNDNPGMLSAGNMSLENRPQVQNPDGSISTVRTISVNIDGKEILIPTVSDDGKSILTDQQAVEQYYRTGKHLGTFKDPASATAYAQKLHESQERLVEISKMTVEDLNALDVGKMSQAELRAAAKRQKQLGGK